MMIIMNSRRECLSTIVSAGHRLAIGDEVSFTKNVFLLLFVVF